MITEREAYIESWLGEERAAHIHGWDFSHIQGRYDEEQDLPWSYEDTVRRFLAPESLLLDIDTGGGEFLLSLGHPHGRTAATEFYPPNVQLCRETLTPLGIDFREADSRGVLPFPDRSFDLVINRHGDYRPEEIRRILKPGGVFVTEQVGAENDRALVELLLPETPPLPFPEQYLDLAAGKLRRLGFSRSGRPSGPSGSGTWGRWSGSPGSSRGNFPDFLWRAAWTGSFGPRRRWSGTG